MGTSEAPPRVEVNAVNVVSLELGRLRRAVNGRDIPGALTAVEVVLSGPLTAQERQQVAEALRKALWVAMEDEDRPVELAVTFGCLLAGLTSP